MLAFSSADLAHTSGFVAVYLCGLVLATPRCRTASASIGFAEGMASLAQIGLFVLLGLLVSPDRLAEAVRPGAAHRRRAAAGRPAAVGGASLVWFRIPWSQQVFISWAGLRGAVPIVLATFPLTAEVPGATFMFDTVFVLVVVFTLVQGWSLPWVARRLGIATPVTPRDVAVESAPLDELDADLMQMTVPAGLAAARRVPARAAAARGRGGGADRPRRALLRARRDDPAACAGTRRCWSSARRSRRGGRAAAAGGQPGRPAGQPGGARRGRHRGRLRAAAWDRVPGPPTAERACGSSSGLPPPT